MSIGEHLEELRRRLILGLIGFVIALAGCLVFGKQVTSIFCGPLIETLRARNLNPVLHYTELSDPFMVFIKISLISALAVSSPWLLFQLWQFVAAGLYPHEQKWVKRFLPLSIGLLVGGMVFVYYLVLPWTIVFFVDFAGEIPLPKEFRPPATVVAEDVGKRPNRIAALQADPVDPQDYDLWFNTTEDRLKFYRNDQAHVLMFGPENLVSPIITLPHYIGLVLALLVTFGLCFQLPLVVFGLERMGIVPLETLRGARRYVYFLMAIAAAVITPGDVIVVTLALIVPLIFLYELGIWMAKLGQGKKPQDEAQDA